MSKIKIMISACLVLILMGCGSESDESWEIYGDWVEVSTDPSPFTTYYMSFSKGQLVDKTVDLEFNCYTETHTYEITSLSASSVTLTRNGEVFPVNYSVEGDRLNFGDDEDIYYVSENTVPSEIPPCENENALGSFDVEMTFSQLPSNEDILKEPNIDIVMDFDLDSSGDISEGDVFLVVKYSPYPGDPKPTSINNLYARLYYYSAVTDESKSWITIMDLDYQVEGNRFLFSIPRSTHVVVENLNNTIPLMFSATYSVDADNESGIEYRSKDQLPDTGYTINGIDLLSLTDNADDLDVREYSDYVISGDETHLDIIGASISVSTN